MNHPASKTDFAILVFASLRLLTLPMTMPCSIGPYSHSSKVGQHENYPWSALGYVALRALGLRCEAQGKVFQGKHLEFLHGVFAGVMVEFEGEVEILFAPDKCGAGNQYPHQIALAVSVSLVEQVFEMGAYGIA